MDAGVGGVGDAGSDGDLNATAEGVGGGVDSCGGARTGDGVDVRKDLYRNIVFSRDTAKYPENIKCVGKERRVMNSAMQGQKHVYRWNQ